MSSPYEIRFRRRRAMASSNFQSMFPGHTAPGQPINSNIGQSASVIFPEQFNRQAAANNPMATPASSGQAAATMLDPFSLEPKGSAMSDLTREEIQAQIAASEARGDTRVARLEGKIDTAVATLSGKLDALSDKISADHAYHRGTRWIIIGLALALAALVVTMATYGDAMFGRGMDVRDVVQSTIKETLAQQAHDQLPRK
jgi:hypothetical protein